MPLNIFFLGEWNEMSPISYLMQVIYRVVRDTLSFWIVLPHTLRKSNVLFSSDCEGPNKWQGRGTAQSQCGKANHSGPRHKWPGRPYQSYTIPGGVSTLVLLRYLQVPKGSLFNSRLQFSAFAQWLLSILFNGFSCASAKAVVVK